MINETLNSYNQFSTIVQAPRLHDCTDCTVLYSILCCAPDDERLDSFETCRADKKLWNKKLLIRIVHLIGH